MSTEDKSPPDVNDVLKILCARFAETINTDRRKAWRDFMNGIITNAPVLVMSRVTQRLRDVVSMLAEIDRSILGGGDAGNVSEPLDAIADRWTKDEQDEAGGKELPN